MNVTPVPMKIEPLDFLVCPSDNGCVHAEGNLIAFDQSVSFELDITHCEGTRFVAGDLYFCFENYEGYIIRDLYGLLSVTICEGDKVIYSHGFGTDHKVRLQYATYRPLLTWIISAPWAFCYYLFSMAEERSKGLPDLRWAMYAASESGYDSIQWTITNLRRTTKNDGFVCNVYAGKPYEHEPVYQLVIPDGKRVANMRVFFEGEEIDNPKGQSFDCLCDGISGAIKTWKKTHPMY